MDKFNPTRIRNYAAKTAVETIANLIEELKTLQTQCSALVDDGASEAPDFDQLASDVDFAHEGVAALARNLHDQVIVIQVACGIRVG